MAAKTSRDMMIEVRGKVFFHWVLIAANGEVLATSETYFIKGNALRAARTLSTAVGVPVDSKVYAHD